MKQIEKLTIDSAERNWDMANVRDMLYELIDSHNSQAGEERDWCHCGRSEQDGIHDEKYCSTSKQDPIDIDALLKDYSLKFAYYYDGTLHDEKRKEESMRRMKEISEQIKSAIRQ